MKTNQHLTAALKWSEPVSYVHYIYVMAGGGRTLKLGITGNPEQRLAYMRSHSGRKLRIVYLQECVSQKQARRIEVAAHALLARHRVYGEWYRISATKAKAVVIEADKFAKPHKPATSAVQQETAA